MLGTLQILGGDVSRHALRLGPSGQRLSGVLQLKEAGPKKPPRACDHLFAGAAPRPSAGLSQVVRGLFKALVSDPSMCVCSLLHFYTIFFLPLLVPFPIIETKPALIPSLMARNVPEAAFHGFPSTGSEMVPRWCGAQKLIRKSLKAKAKAGVTKCRADSRSQGERRICLSGIQTAASGQNNFPGTSGANGVPYVGGVSAYIQFSYFSLTIKN